MPARRIGVDLALRVGHLDPAQQRDAFCTGRLTPHTEVPAQHLADLLTDPHDRIGGSYRSRVQPYCSLLMEQPERIAWLAHDFGVKYIGHGWNTALGVAADLQLASAFPDTDLVEFIGGSPYVDGILRQPFTLDAEGYLNIPDLPGLGVELDPDQVGRYTPDASSLFAD